ncbi:MULTISPECIES: nuclear transport factor 2 family protein [Bifidobacterium]|jgi:hypothetical protein|nr:nuclear transport factor 2 family protein [Bifidobacterium tibiigranuli]
MVPDVCSSGSNYDAGSLDARPHAARFRITGEVGTTDATDAVGATDTADGTATTDVKTAQNAREQSVRRYFAMWKTRDFSDLDKLFARDCRYEECYGPVYRGLEQMHRWISDMLAKQIVDSWDIHEMRHGMNPLGLPMLTVTWTFSGREKESYIFDGVSIIEFNDKGYMSRVREFEAQHDRVFPYDDK